MKIKLIGVGVLTILSSIFLLQTACANEDLGAVMVTNYSTCTCTFSNENDNPSEVCDSHHSSNQPIYYAVKENDDGQYEYETTSIRVGQTQEIPYISSSSMGGPVLDVAFNPSNDVGDSSSETTKAQMNGSTEGEVVTLIINDDAHNIHTSVPAVAPSDFNCTVDNVERLYQ